VLLAQLSLAAQILENALEFVSEIVEHAASENYCSRPPADRSSEVASTRTPHGNGTRETRIISWYKMRERVWR
jgi:hypothetical protein